MSAQDRRRFRVTLYVECYDDIQLEDRDWNNILDLQGDEFVYARIRELVDIYQPQSQYQLGDDEFVSHYPTFYEKNYYQCAKSISGTINEHRPQNRVLQFQVKQFTPKMINNDTLEMLTAREQLMEDIDAIMTSQYLNDKIDEDDMEDLIVMLCDAVCKNFPTK